MWLLKRIPVLPPVVIIVVGVENKEAEQQVLTPSEQNKTGRMSNCFTLLANKSIFIHFSCGLDSLTITSCIALLIFLTFPVWVRTDPVCLSLIHVLVFLERNAYRPQPNVSKFESKIYIFFMLKDNSFADFGQILKAKGTMSQNIARFSLIPIGAQNNCFRCVSATTIEKSAKCL